jgi:VWFA-related protein
VKTRLWCASLRLGFPALLATGWLLAFPAASPAQTLERDLFVSVLNQKDEPVTTLRPQDFIVREDGRVREVLRLRPATDPIDLAILVDTSQSLGSSLNDLRLGLEGLVGRLAGKANIALIGVGDRPTILTPYTKDPAQLKKAIGRVFSLTGAGATFLEGLDETLTGLTKRHAEREAILVVRVGGPETSSVPYEPLLGRLHDSGVTLHVVTVGPPLPDDAATTDGRSREIVFDRGTKQSGGRRQNVLTSMGIDDALTRLAAELLSQYRLTYARPTTLVPPDKIEVGVRDASLTVRMSPVIPPAKASGK